MEGSDQVQVMVLVLVTGGQLPELSRPSSRGTVGPSPPPDGSVPFRLNFLLIHKAQQRLMLPNPNPSPHPRTPLSALVQPGGLTSQDGGFHFKPGEGGPD